MRHIEEYYSTGQMAALVGIHPNTVRLYEEIGFISKPQRKPNGYRVFTRLHLYQFRIARAALRVEILQNGLRKKAIGIIRACAECDFEMAAALNDEYMAQLDTEMTQADEAAVLAAQLLSDETKDDTRQWKRKEVSELLCVPMDTLRNWEMNGLLVTKRRENGYRVYGQQEIRRLKIIRSLRCANYSLSAILRMLNARDSGCSLGVSCDLNRTPPDEDIFSACDNLIESLSRAKENALYIACLLKEIKS